MQFRDFLGRDSWQTFALAGKRLAADTRSQGRAHPCQGQSS